ncbi:MAG: hypothetical protein GY869_21485 [Planctomycetes bacterium]|nr:hypothetical protein [Planctomycetota bacterium]
MKGDFSRNTFRPEKQFTRVLMQQGRVQLDADWNEQTSILLHYLRTMTKDIIGLHGGPENSIGFEISPPDGENDNFSIGVGDYYVDGILCKNKANLLHTEQPDSGESHLFYLDVWERHLSPYQDEDERTPGIREVALGTADTASRARVEWQVKTMAIDEAGIIETPDTTVGSKLTELENKSNTLASKLEPATLQSDLVEQKLATLRSNLDTKRSELSDKINNLGAALSSLSVDFGEFKTLHKNLAGPLRKLIEDLNKLIVQIPTPPPLIDSSIDIALLELTGNTPTAKIKEATDKINEIIKYLPPGIDVSDIKLDITVPDDDGTSDAKINEIIKRINKIINHINKIIAVAKKIKEIVAIERDIYASETLAQDIKDLKKIIAAHIIGSLKPLSDAFLKAKAGPTEPTTGRDPCITYPNALYRGPENQLYRVEIHQGGSAEEATFKWSRENGSVIFPIHTMIGTTVEVTHLGRDSRLGLQENDWVEIVDDNKTLKGERGRLLQVDSIDSMEMTVILRTPQDNNGELPAYEEHDAGHPLLRRWDHKTVNSDDLIDGAIPVSKAELTKTEQLENDWFELEDGARICFKPNGLNTTYRTGDYWLIPARTATHNVEWPTKEEGNPEEEPPFGVKHYFAPLALLKPKTDGFTVFDLRCKFSQLGHFSVDRG